jgi:hypothetical protein
LFRGTPRLFALPRVKRRKEIAKRSSEISAKSER